MTEEIIEILKKYVAPEHQQINNWEIIVQRKEEITAGITLYKTSFQDIYLNSNLEPVTYGKQHIIDNQYFYDFNTSEEGSGTYTYICDVIRGASDE